MNPAGASARRISMRLAGIFLLAISLSAADLERGRKLFQSGSYKAAVDAFSSAPSGAEMLLWLGKSLVMSGEPKRASDALEQAVKLQPSSSEAHQWLGRAYGRRAENSNMLSAASLASKARQGFEKAVSLDGRNLPAMLDLLEYYVEAPGFMGGGIGKAQALADKIKPLSATRYHFALARIAEKNKNVAAAEQNYRRAAELENSAGAWLDLGRFLAKQGRYQESEQAFVKAEQIDAKQPRILYERANAYVRARSNGDKARQLLQRYMTMPLGVNDPTVDDARRLLKQIS